MPGRAAKPVVLVEDNGPIHVSKLSRAALTARAHWLTVEWLPKYTPELNDIEVVWRDLKAFNLAHQTFNGVAELDGANSQGSRRSEPRACGRSVGKATNLCLACQLPKPASPLPATG
jgi:DDE superfamily endonuclease